MPWDGTENWRPGRREQFQIGVKLGIPALEIPSLCHSQTVTAREASHHVTVSTVYPPIVVDGALERLHGYLKILAANERSKPGSRVL
jgi:hypothetical protein